MIGGQYTIRLVPPPARAETWFCADCGVGAERHLALIVQLRLSRRGVTWLDCCACGNDCFDCGHRQVQTQNQFVYACQEDSEKGHRRRPGCGLIENQVEHSGAKQVSPTKLSRMIEGSCSEMRRISYYLAGPFWLYTPIWVMFQF